MPRIYNPPRCPMPALWPETDRQRWERSQQENRDILEASNAAAEWAPRTGQRVGQDYGRWISWLAEKGYLDPNSSPGDRVSRERVIEYVAALRTLNAPGTVLSRIQGLYLALAVIAPDRDWAWIHKTGSQIKRTLTRSHRGRIGLPTSARLYALGLELMNEAETPSVRTLVEQAVRYRDGLQVSFLAACPLRRHNFAAIEMGRHLVKEGDQYSIRFEAAETKTRTPIEVPFPAALVSYLERYLSVHRPLLVACHGYWRKARAAHSISALWVSQHGTPMAEVAISGRFKKLTTDRLGRPVTMHRFRDCAATTIAEDSPEQVSITKCILGHASMRASEKHYNQAKSLQAFRRHQAHVLELRRTLARMTKMRRAKSQSGMVLSAHPKIAAPTNED